MASNVSLPTFKDYLGTERTVKDAELQTTLDAAELGVFQVCRRRIVEAGATPATRVYVPLTRWLVEVDDFASISAVADDGTAVAGSGYQLEPLNGLAADGSGEYRPYSAIRRTTSSWSGQWSSWSDPRNQLPGEATVSVTGIPGWTSVPSSIPLAIMMVGKDLRSSKDVSYGILFTDAVAVRIRQNPTVMEMLRDYRKDPVMIG